MAELGEEVSEVRNCTNALKSDTNYTREELANVETTVKRLGTKVESLEGELQENHLKIIANVETTVGGLRSELGAKVESLEGELGEVKHYTLVHTNHTCREGSERHEGRAYKPEKCPGN